MSEDKCPKCQGPRDPNALYCAFCGVVYAKFLAAAAASPAPAAGAPADPWVPPKPAADPWAPPPPSNPWLPGSAEPPTGEALNPYAPPGSTYHPTWRDERTGFELATRGSRLAAQLVNGFGAMVLFLIAALPGIVVDKPNLVLVGVGFAAVGWVLWNIQLLAANGQSFGKKALGIKIVQIDGQPAGLGTLILRRYVLMQLIGLIPAVGTLVAIINILMIFGEQRRCLHDLFADTVVVVA